MELNRAVAWDRREILRNELEHIGEHGEIDLKGSQRLTRFLNPQGRQRVGLDAQPFGRNAQGIGRLSRLLRSREHARHAVSPLHECIENGFTEVLLTHDRNAH